MTIYAGQGSNVDLATVAEVDQEIQERSRSLEEQLSRWRELAGSLDDLGPLAQAEASYEITAARTRVAWEKARVAAYQRHREEHPDTHSRVAEREAEMDPEVSRLHLEHVERTAEAKALRDQRRLLSEMLRKAVDVARDRLSAAQSRGALLRIQGDFDRQGPQWTAKTESETQAPDDLADRIWSTSSFTPLTAIFQPPSPATEESERQEPGAEGIAWPFDDDNEREEVKDEPKLDIPF